MQLIAGPVFLERLPRAVHMQCSVIGNGGAVLPGAVYCSGLELQILNRAITHPHLSACPPAMEQLIRGVSKEGFSRSLVEGIHYKVTTANKCC